MTLGDAIKQYRTEHRMSMDAFARASGLSKAYISILERNFNPTTQRPVVPSIVTFKCASMAMKIDLNDLLAMVDEDQPVYLSPEAEPNSEKHSEVESPSTTDEEYDIESLRRIMKRFGYELDIQECGILKKGKKTRNLSRDEVYEMVNRIFQYVEFVCDKAMEGFL